MDAATLKVTGHKGWDSFLISCDRSPALLVSILIASIDGDCRGSSSNGCFDLDRLDLVGYCVKGNSGNINKGVINMIKGNDNIMYSFKSY